MKVNLLGVFLILIGFVNVGYSQQESFQSFGFFDFETEFNSKDEIGRSGTFDQHHLNILANYLLDDHFSISSEIEWEHGPFITSKSGSGKIYLAKAFLTYKHTDAFKIKAGKFLSPFGIYNERHDATPTFLSTFLPQSIYGSKTLAFDLEDRLFAKFSTGIQVFGNLHLRDWGLKYQVYFSNGRGDKSSEKDNNVNKGIGGRFVLSPPLKGLKIGTSYYFEENGLIENAKQEILGIDLTYDLSAFHLEAEYIFPSIEKHGVDSMPNGNFRKLKGYYIQGAYTFFDKLTPFVRYEYFDPDLKLSNNAENCMVFGINYAATLAVYLKGEVHLLRYQNPTINEYEVFVLSVAVAF